MKIQREGGFLIAKIHQLAGRIFSRMLRENGIEINPAQGRIMFVLWQKDGIPINELAKKTALGKSTLTSMLDRLETSGYIKRTQSVDDRRATLIKRTEKDRAFEKLYTEVSHRMIRISYQGFKRKEIDQFEAQLRKIFDNLAQHEKGKGQMDMSRKEGVK
ncbi:MAG: MarR family transcriptional regulator [candidate division WOR-3 bacterium]|nr:MAG: MarR family transcriptional regulator [candidate division WOR-3 bacterium]